MMLKNMELVDTEKIKFDDGSQAWALGFLETGKDSGIRIWLKEGTQFFDEEWTEKVGSIFTLTVNRKIANDGKVKYALVSYE